MEIRSAAPSVSGSQKQRPPAFGNGQGISRISHLPLIQR